MGYRRWKPSKTAARQFAQKMNDIEVFCLENGISQSRRGDSYYFTIDGQEYRVSNHTVEASNAAAFDDFGQKKRALYHDGGRQDNIIYIHASKTRIIEIYKDLKAGYVLDGRGNRKEV